MSYSKLSLNDEGSDPSCKGHILVTFECPRDVQISFDDLLKQLHSKHLEWDIAIKVSFTDYFSSIPHVGGAGTSSPKTRKGQITPTIQPVIHFSVAYCTLPRDIHESTNVENGFHSQPGVPSDIQFVWKDVEQYLILKNPGCKLLRTPYVVPLKY